MRKTPHKILKTKQTSHTITNKHFYNNKMDGFCQKPKTNSTKPNALFNLKLHRKKQIRAIRAPNQILKSTTANPLSFHAKCNRTNPSSEIEYPHLHGDAIDNTRV